MRKMNRMMAGLVSAAAIVAMITGCGGSANAGNAATTKAAGTNTAGTAIAADASTAAAADGVYNMAYVVSSEDEWLSLLKDEVVEAAQEKGVNMEVLFSGNDAMKIIDCVEAAKSKGKDAVLINLHAAEEAQACIEAAGDDMKVVFVNREPDNKDLLNENVTVVGSDEHQSGRLQGQFLADYFKKNGKTDVSYILIKGTDGLVHTTLRSEGVIAAMKEAGLNPVESAVVTADYGRNTAKLEMDEVLPATEYDCIISNNDAMALGAILAMKDAGVEPGSVPVVGIDATEDARNALRNGEMAMTVFQSAEGQAKGAVQAAINMLEGKDLAEGTECEVSTDNPYTLYFPFIPVTAENVDDI